MTKKKDSSLTKREALSLAWKSRKDYKGYDRTKGSSYNSWRAIVYTEKGRSIGFPSEWRSYNTFVSDIQGEWKLEKIVCRFDTQKPHSKDNSYWADKGTENSGKLIVFEYDGISKTLVEWAMDLNLSYQGIRQRYFKGKGYTPKEVLFGKERKFRGEQERTQEFRIRRMFGAYRLRDKNKGLNNDLTLDFFKEEIKNGCIYCGDLNNVGLDRIDNTKGHEKSNVVSCCYDCNCARMDNFSLEEMKIIGLAIKEIKRMRNESKQA